MTKWTFRTVLVKRGFAGWKWMRSWHGGSADESELFSTFYECVEDARGVGYPGPSTLAEFMWETTGGYITATPAKPAREPGIIATAMTPASHAAVRDPRAKRQAA